MVHEHTRWSVFPHLVPAEFLQLLQGREEKRGWIREREREKARRWRWRRWRGRAGGGGGRDEGKAEEQPGEEEDKGRKSVLVNGQLAGSGSQ